MDHRRRLKAAREALAANDLPGLLVTHGVNIRWLVGFTGSNARLVLTEASATLVTDARYAIQAPAELEAAGVADLVDVVVTDERGWKGFAGLAGRDTPLGVEASSLSWADAKLLEEELPVALVPTFGLVEELRTVKDADELAAIERAVELADASLTEILRKDWVGREELELTKALDWEMRERGAAGESFPTIVAAGPNGARPHARPGNAKIPPGAPVVIDFGCVLEGYCSDATRTIVWGDVPEDVAEIHAVVAEAQAAARARAVAGTQCWEVDAAARSVIDAAGWGDHFVHGTGHGIGLDVHEPPRIGATSEAALRPGNVVTIEPGIYVPDLGGVRIEDIVVVGETGARTLTSLPRGLTDLLPA